MIESNKMSKNERHFKDHKGYVGDIDMDQIVKKLDPAKVKVISQEHMPDNIVLSSEYKSKLCHNLKSNNLTKLLSPDQLKKIDNIRTMINPELSLSDVIALVTRIVLDKREEDEIVQMICTEIDQNNSDGLQPIALIE
jgi:hypothetical protein